MAKLVNLLDDWDVPWEHDQGEDKSWKIVVEQDWQDDVPTIDGYRGFYTQFNFDEDGQFISMGAWE